MSKPEYVESWLNNAGNKRGWSGSQVRLTRLELTIYRTDHFRPLAPNPPTSPRAAPRDLGRSRAISGDLGAPRHASPPHPTSPTAAPRYLGRSRSVARAASHLLKKGRAWLEPRGSRGRARSVLAASPCATWAGEAAPRAARPSPRHADPCAHRSSSALSGLLLRSRRGTRRYSLPPTSDGLGRFCAPWRLCMSRVPACQGWCQGQFNCQGWCQGQINCLAGAKAQRLSPLSLSSLSTLSTFSLSLP